MLFCNMTCLYIALILFLYYPFEGTIAWKTGQLCVFFFKIKRLMYYMKLSSFKTPMFWQSVYANRTPKNKFTVFVMFFE